MIVLVFYLLLEVLDLFFHAIELFWVDKGAWLHPFETGRISKPGIPTPHNILNPIFKFLLNHQLQLILFLQLLLIRPFPLQIIPQGLNLQHIIPLTNINLHKLIINPPGYLLKIYLYQPQKLIIIICGVIVILSEEVNALVTERLEFVKCCGYCCAYGLGLIGQAFGLGLLGRLFDG